MPVKEYLFRSFLGIGLIKFTAKTASLTAELIFGEFFGESVLNNFMAELIFGELVRKIAVITYI